MSNMRKKNDSTLPKPAPQISPNKTSKITKKILGNPMESVQTEKLPTKVVFSRKSSIKVNKGNNSPK